MGQYTIKDIQDQTELLKASVQSIYRSIYTKLGLFPNSLDNVPFYIIQRLYPSPTIEPLTITPSTEQQEFTTPENVKYNPITVEPVTSNIDGNITPENIKEGVTILGVVGTLKEGLDVFVVPPEMRFAYSTFAEIPLNFDFSNVTDMSYMFYHCSNIATIPLISTSAVTNMSNAFGWCTNITTIHDQFDTSKVTNLDYAFYYCTNLTTIPQLDLSSVTTMINTFRNCSKLAVVPSLNTFSVTDMSYTFGSCNALTTVEGIDFSGLTSSPKLFYTTSSTSISKSKITRFIVNGKINVSISDEYSIKSLTAIDYDSVKSILTAAANTDNTDAKTLAFNRTMTDQNGELAALVTSCAAKGWTITGLTLK